MRTAGMPRRRSDSMEIDDQESSTIQHLSQTSGASVSSQQQHPPTDAIFFKRPVDAFSVRARKTPSRIRLISKTNANELESSEDDNESLFDMVKNNSEVGHLGDIWIDVYKRNPERAFAILMEFFINSSGNSGKITPEMLGSMEVPEIANKIITESDDTVKECPLIVTNLRERVFPLNFCNFIDTLILKCKHSILYDNYLMKNLTIFLTELSHSDLRVFRHTATLAAVKIMTALTEVISMLAENLEKNRRQYNIQKQTFPQREAADMLRSLWFSRNELKKNLIEVNRIMNNLLDSIFNQRCRDTLPDIRSMCIEECGVWLGRIPKTICTENNLNSIGHSLFDGTADVRLKALKVIQSLYASQELKQLLEGFNNKFKNRIVAMTLDEEIGCAIESVKLLIIIYKNYPEILNEKDFDDIYELIYAENRSLALEAGNFLKEMCFVSADEVLEVRRHNGTKRSSNTSMMRDLVQFFIESELPEYCDYLVDALIDNNEMMQDWECMTDLLLQAAELNGQGLDEEHEMGLIKIMVSCIKQVSTGLSPLGRKKKPLTGKEQQRVTAAREKLTIHFIKTLPDLLQKYRNDVDLLGLLFEIPQYFELDIYVKDHKGEYLEILLDIIKEIADETNDEKVFENLSITLQYFCEEFHLKASQCDAERGRIKESLERHYKSAIGTYSISIRNSTVDQEEIDNVIVSLRKISIFYAHHDLNECNLWDSLVGNMESAKDPSKNFPEEATQYCLEACFFALTWRQNALLCDDIDDDEYVAANLKVCLDLFMEQLKYFLTSKEINISDNIREKAYMIICDLLIMFNKSLRLAPNELLHMVVYEPDTNMCDILSTFVKDNVFIEGNSRLEESNNRRRNFLMAFCKLIMFSVLPIKSAAEVFKNYVKYYNDYGDIIKMTLAKAREINRVNCALTMQLSLNILFNEVFKTKDGVITNEDIKSIKELARRFKLLFGFDAEKSKDEVYMVHVSGMNFVARASKDSAGIPTNLLYFDVLLEFSPKLLKEDKKKALELLSRKLPIGSLNNDGKWKPLMRYRKSLLLGGEDEFESTSKEISPSTGRDQSKALQETDKEGNENSKQHTKSRQKDTKKPKDKKKRERTSKKTPLAVTKKRGRPKASTPGTTHDTSSESFHTVPAEVQKRLEAMAIQL